MTRAFNKPIVCPIVVGRLADVTKLYELVDEASSGHGQIVLISGEAGVGKSRLIEEVKAYARTHNFQVFQGNCFQVDSSYPYAPLLDLLRTSVEPNAYDAGVEPIFLEFARLLPELSFSLTETPSEFLSDPEQRKHRLFAALTHFFKEQSHQRPVLLIIEDLHWCDDISLEFFQSLARLCRNQAILFLATYRSDEIQPSLQYFLSQLDRIRMSQELRLSPLSRSDIEKMLDTMFSLSDDERLHLLDLIYPLTEGNPFFAEEVLTLLIARDELLFDNGTWHYKLLIEKRNERLPNLTLHARSLNRLGNWLVNTGHIQEGIEAHQAALHLFETQLNMQDMAETLDLLAVAYGFDGNSASAVKTLERAIELFRRLGNQRGLLSSLASGSLDSAPEKIITTVSPLKTRDECMQNVREALQLAHQTNLQSELAFVEFVAAQVLLSFGEFGNAFDHAQKSLRIATAIEHQQWLTASYGALGQLYLLLLAPSQAISALRLGMMYAETLGSAFWHSYLASFLAQTYVLQRDFSSAEKLLKSIMPREQEPANAGERHIAYIWGELALADGEPDVALTIAEHLMLSAPNNAESQPIPHLLALKGNALLKLHRLEEATFALEEAKRGAEQRQAPSIRWRIHCSLGHVSSLRHKHEHAQHEYATARGIIMKLAKTIEQADIRDHFEQAALLTLASEKSSQPRKAATEKYDGLTPREIEVLRYVAYGLTDAQVAEKLVISHRTVHSHLNSIYSKLGITSRSAATRYAIEHHLA